MQDVTLVFDIGKTNKKLILFDRNVRIVHESSVTIPEIDGTSALLYDDLQRILNWMDAALRDIGRAKKFTVRAINVTTFGATVVHLDKKGEVATPVYSYLCQPNGDLHSRYLEAISAAPGGFARLATPPLEKFLNVAKQLFWLTETQATLVQQIAQTLFLPQFLIYRLTGARFSEPTSLGCHTGLWDFESKQPSAAVLSRLRWQNKLPPLLVSNEQFTLEHSYRSLLQATDDVIIGTGLHDSSSALVPFTRALKKNFVLVSTGTWIIAQNPDAAFHLSEQDLAEDRLYYLTPQCTPVRAARLFAGREHEVQLQRIAQHFGQPPDAQTTSSKTQFEGYLPAFFAEHTERALVPETLHGSGPFPKCHHGNWELSAFGSAEEAYARLCLDLAALTSYCIDSVADEQTEQIVVDGGFARNVWFIHALAMLQATRKVAITEVPQATALGTALQVHQQWAGTDVQNDLSLQPISARPIAGVRLYAERFLAILQG